MRIAPVTLRAPLPGRPRPLVAVAPLTALVLVAGCAHAPALPDAADRLDRDSRAILDAGGRRLGQPSARPRVVLDERRSCPDGRARQEWHGTVPLRPGPDPRITLDDATDVAIALGRARGYRLGGVPAATRRSRTFTLTHDDPSVRIVVRVTGRHGYALDLDAATPCLPRG